MISFQTFFIALGVSADAFAVSVATGVSEKKIHLRNALGMSLSFGIFQGIMPIIGFLLASIFAEFITAYDHWIAFFILSFLGGKMIYEGWGHDEDSDEVKPNVFSFSNIMILSIATSIDALAIGLSYAAMQESIYIPALVIGVITFVMSFIGIEFGKRFGESLGSRAEIFGGGVLILIGGKILLEHTGIL